MTDQEIRAKLGPDARAILLDRNLKSFTRGSDQLVALGLWSDDGTPTDQCVRIVEDMKREERREQ